MRLTARRLRGMGAPSTIAAGERLQLKADEAQAAIRLSDPDWADRLIFRFKLMIAIGGSRP